MSWIITETLGPGHFLLYPPRPFADVLTFLSAWEQHGARTPIRMDPIR